MGILDHRYTNALHNLLNCADVNEDDVIFFIGSRGHIKLTNDLHKFLSDINFNFPIYNRYFSARRFDSELFSKIEKVRPSVVYFAWAHNSFPKDRRLEIKAKCRESNETCKMVSMPYLNRYAMEEFVSFDQEKILESCNAIQEEWRKKNGKEFILSTEESTEGEPNSHELITNLPEDEEEIKADNQHDSPSNVFNIPGGEVYFEKPTVKGEVYVSTGSYVHVGGGEMREVEDYMLLDFSGGTLNIESSTAGDKSKGILKGLKEALPDEESCKLEEISLGANPGVTWGNLNRKGNNFLNILKINGAFHLAFKDTIYIKLRKASYTIG